VKRLPRRSAHALSALMTATRELRMPPTAAEICVYDPEAISVRSTAAALREASRKGLCACAPGGYWVAATAAMEMERELEDRLLADTDESEDDPANDEEAQALIDAIRGIKEKPAPKSQVQEAG
jgi:hypothetical protein